MFLYKEFNSTDWTLSDDVHLNVGAIIATGDSATDLLEDAIVHLHDWNGNEGPTRPVGDLSTKDFEHAKRVIEQFIKERQ